MEQVSQDAFHNSRERSKEISPEIVKPLVQKWASRLKALLSRLSTDASFVSLTYPGSSLGPLMEPDNPDEIIKDVYAWLFDRSTPFHIMWVHGENLSQTNLVGQVIAGVSHELGILSASFFSSVVDGLEDTVDNACAIPTLAYQLAQNIPDTRLAIADAIANDRSIFNLEIQTQIQRLITDPLLRMAGTQSIPRVFLIHGPEYFSNAHHFQSSFLTDFADALSKIDSSNAPHRLLILGKRTSYLQECISSTSMRQIVLQRPVMARSWWGKELEISRKVEEVKGKAEEISQRIRQKEKEVRQKEEDVLQKGDNVRRKEENVRQKEEEVWQKEGEVWQKEKDVQQKEWDICRKEEEIRRKEKDIQQKEWDIRQKEEEIRRKENNVWQRETKLQQKEEKIQRQEEVQGLQQKEEIPRKDTGVWAPWKKFRPKMEAIQSRKSDQSSESSDQGWWESSGNLKSSYQGCPEI